jgi:hypothetical protein
VTDGPVSELSAELDEDDELEETVAEELESELEAASLDDEDEDEEVDEAGLEALGGTITCSGELVGRTDPPFSTFLFFTCPPSLELLLFRIPNSCLELPALNLTLQLCQPSLLG